MSADSRLLLSLLSILLQYGKVVHDIAVARATGVAYISVHGNCVALYHCLLKHTG